MVGMMFITANSSNYSFRLVYLDEFDDPSGDDSLTLKRLLRRVKMRTVQCAYVGKIYLPSSNMCSHLINQYHVFVGNVFCKDFYVNLLCK